MADCGALIIGVPIMLPKTPPEIIKYMGTIGDRECATCHIVWVDFAGFAFVG
jgi:hypothetical protein